MYRFRQLVEEDVVKRLTPHLALIAALTLLAIPRAFARDAACIDLRSLLSDHDFPLRMLCIGMPLTIITGSFRNRVS